MSVLQDFHHEYKTSLFTSENAVWLCRASGSITHKVTDARGAFITHFSNFCKSKVDHGWLTEGKSQRN